MMDERRKVDKAFGALAGLAIGDSFGDASRTEANHQRFGITMDFTAEASWSTDDTEFALLTAQALIDCGGQFSTEAVVAAWEKYILYQEDFHRGGSSEIEAVVNLRRGLKPPYTTTVTERPCGRRPSASSVPEIWRRRPALPRSMRR